MTPPVPRSRVLAELSQAHRRLDACVVTLRPGQHTASSRLPGWSRAHVLTHLARNADAHRRRIEGALAGRSVPQYAGGLAERNAEIEEGARRPLDELVADVQAASAALDRAWPADPDDPAWAVRSRDLSGIERTIGELPLRRWQEVEVHLVDLDLGVRPNDWPEAFVDEVLPRMRADVALRLPAGTQLPDPMPCPPAEELAWLFGRMAVPGLPVLGPWT